MHGEWFEARARGYKTTLDAALFGNAIPTSVVENLIGEAKNGSAAFRRYHKLRKRVLGLDDYYVFDAFIPLVDHQVKYAYDEVLDWIVEAVAPLGPDYQARVRRAFAERWIDVYENQGKRSGAYSAPVYGANPYMLMNYNDTLDAVFTLAHELGHSMHTTLSHDAQPFVYSAYTIFVAEVPSTLNEALLLDFMLKRANSKEERAVLLQHAIDGIVGTFYNQVLFADFELEAHRLVERDQPITSEVLSGIYGKLLGEYWGDALSPDPRTQHTWARIPHFFQSPYYVYQYATCFASTAKLMDEIGGSDAVARRAAVDRYLHLLKSGGSDHPMTLLRTAGVDLSKPETVRAVSAQLDGLVDHLERELA
jgi:oligoendopeptidase F